MNAHKAATTHAAGASEATGHLLDGEAWLARLSRKIPEARWVSLWQVGRAEALPSVNRLCLHPPRTTMPPVVGSLAIRGVLGGKVVHVGDAEPVLMAIPLPTRGEMETGHVLVAGLDPLDERRRIAVTRQCLGDWTDAGAALAGAFGDGDVDEDPDRRTETLSHELLLAVNRQRSADELAQVLVTSIARIFQASRVSLAREHANRARLVAVSGQARIDPQRDLAVSMIDVLDEGLRSSQPIGWSAPMTSSPAGRCAGSERLERFASLNGAMPYRVVVFGEPRRVRHALMLEWPVGTVDLPARPEEIQALLEPCMTFVQARVEASDGWPGRLRRIRQGVVSHRAFPHLPVRTTLCLVGLLAMIAGIVVDVPMQVSARASVEALDRQILSAPQDGHLLSARVRAGDRVREGELLARLDDRELRFSIDRRQADLQRNVDERNRALAARDRVELATLRAEHQRLAAELKSAEAELARSEIRAPFDALVLKGDPGQSLGAAVKAGDVLFEIAADEGHRLMLEIDEADVALIRANQTSTVRMSAAPDESLEVRLGRLLPVAIAEEGGSVFRVPATIENGQMPLHPGMQGVARIDVGQSSLLMSRTRRLRDRLRLLAWRLGLLR